MADIVISEAMHEASVDELRRKFEVLYDAGLVDRPAELRERLKPARALIVRNRTQVTAELLGAGPRLTAVGRLGVGLDNIDMAACEARGVAVYPATGANAVAVAEYVITTALVLLRGAYDKSEAVISGAWPRAALMGGRELSGKHLGLIGFGSIAHETAKRAAALGMVIAAADPFVDPETIAAAGAKPVGLDELLAVSDVVSLHVPLTPETRNLIDGERIARMKRGAVLINSARGGIVDEGALAAALKEGRLGGAALDVFDAEPLNAEAGRFFEGAPNLILTPHIAGVTLESNIRVSSMVAHAILRHLEG